MLKLSEEQIVGKIEAEDTFECESIDGSFTLKIESYNPVICAAVHAGHNFRSNLVDKCRLTEAERLYEEDPFTDVMIQSMPITIVAKDSRYEYDLNRPLANCVYKKAWGKVVWHRNLSPSNRKLSTDKHRLFYRVVDALVNKLERKFGAALIFDVHSYNHLRRDDFTPTFNIGTEQISLDRWQSIVDYSLKQFSQIDLPNMPVSALENAVFYGRGYMISHINSRFQNTLVLPIEIKKVFMDELTGEPYPLVMQSLCQQMKDCLVNISSLFSKRFTSKKYSKATSILTEKLDPSILQVDSALFDLAKRLDTLHYVNPINLQSEKKKFLRQNAKNAPVFHYRQLDINPYLFKEQLYRLPVDRIRDPSIQGLYRDVIDGLSEKVSLLVKSGQPEFVYESLKYYGEPSSTDMQNAQFLLHAAPASSSSQGYTNTEQLIEQMTSAAARWNMPCTIERSSKLVASAMVSNQRKALMVANNLRIPNVEASALVHHELGVHMATTLNASKQRLKLFSLGLPGNTMTQEGLAILNEYHSGNASLGRLKNLALRVLAVRQMLDQNDFRHTFSYLVDEHELGQEEAFNLATRVHRGGGFTKDYLYLNGLSIALDMHKSRDISNLYIGKTGFKYIDIIDEMIERQLVTPPVFIPEYIKTPAHSSAILTYLLGCIKPPANYKRLHAAPPNKAA